MYIDNGDQFKTYFNRLQCAYKQTCCEKKDTLVMFIKEQFDLSRFTSEIPCDIFTDKIIQI